MNLRNKKILKNKRMMLPNAGLLLIRRKNIKIRLIHRLQIHIVPIDKQNLP
jgi:hypothetical protein